MCVESVPRWFVPTLWALSAIALETAPLRAQNLLPRIQIAEDLYDTQLVTADEGWAVGTFGSVYHTTDGGKHWEMQHTPTVQHLYGVSFSDTRNGWAVGRSGSIIHTADGGVHWAEQESNTAKHLFKVCFVGSQKGWAVGDWGVILQTLDGGATWHDHSLGEDLVVYAIDFADRDTGWMVGEGGLIRHTIDGGKTWIPQQAGTEKTLFGVAAVSRAKAWAVGIDGVVERTVDGGDTWQLQEGDRRTVSLESLGSTGPVTSPGLYDIELRGGRGYAVGDFGNVLYSGDAGETWTRLLLPGEWRLSWVRGLSVLPSGRGLLVGASGLTFVADGREMRFSQAAIRKARGAE